MAYDEMELDTIGDKKTALFLIMSDTDSTFNFVIAILQSQLTNLLCDKADDVYGGRLPVHVRFILDEFANIGQIPQFDKLIATIRSREISASIILQSQSQLKAIYRDREIIEENIEYEIMKDRPDGDRLGEIVEIMLDAVCSTAPTIRINGEDMPQQVVKSRFLKLDSSHIEYVFHAMKECPSNIRNIRAYLLTTLYNAPATMDNFYSAKVNHDFNGW